MRTSLIKFVVVTLVTVSAVVPVNAQDGTPNFDGLVDDRGGIPGGGNVAAQALTPTTPIGGGAGVTVAGASPVVANTWPTHITDEQRDIVVTLRLREARDVISAGGYAVGRASIPIAGSTSTYDVVQWRAFKGIISRAGNGTEDDLVSVQLGAVQSATLTPAMTVPQNPLVQGIASGVALSYADHWTRYVSLCDAKMAEFSYRYYAETDPAIQAKHSADYWHWDGQKKIAEHNLQIARTRALMLQHQ